MKGRNSKHTFTRGAAWVVSCALGLALASCQPGGSKSAADLPMRAIGPYRIGARNAPDPPRTGENTLTIVVRDASGAPVKGATVTAVIVMPAMGAMPRMESRGGVVESRPGEYRARYGLGMNGEWDMAIEVAAAGAEPVRADYRLSTSVAGLAFDESGSEPAAGAATGQAAHSGHAGHGDGGSEPLGIVTLDASRRQSLGVRTEPVSVRELSARIRAAGHVTFDESRQTQVTLKFGGYVREVAVAGREFLDAPGERLASRVAVRALRRAPVAHLPAAAVVVTRAMTLFVTGAVDRQRRRGGCVEPPKGRVLPS
jgi:hypothetical protein